MIDGSVYELFKLVKNYINGSQNVTIQSFSRGQLYFIFDVRQNKDSQLSSSAHLLFLNQHLIVYMTDLVLGKQVEISWTLIHKTKSKYLCGFASIFMPFHRILSLFPGPLLIPIIASLAYTHLWLCPLLFHSADPS